VNGKVKGKEKEQALQRAAQAVEEEKYHVQDDSGEMGDDNKEETEAVE
jgi:hypothetical protein